MEKHEKGPPRELYYNKIHMISTYLPLASAEEILIVHLCF